MSIASLAKTALYLEVFLCKLLQAPSKEGENLSKKFLSRLEGLNKKIKERRDVLHTAQGKGETLSTSHEQELAVLNHRAQALEASINILQKQGADFEVGKKPLTIDEIQNLLAKSQSSALVQTVDLDGYNPFIKGLTIDWDSSQIAIDLYPDLQQLRFQEGKPEKEAPVSAIKPINF